MPKSIFAILTASYFFSSSSLANVGRPDSGFPTDCEFTTAIAQEDSVKSSDGKSSIKKTLTIYSPKFEAIDLSEEKIDLQFTGVQSIGSAASYEYETDKYSIYASFAKEPVPGRVTPTKISIYKKMGNDSIPYDCTFVKPKTADSTQKEKDATK